MNANLNLLHFTPRPLTDYENSFTNGKLHYQANFYDQKLTYMQAQPQTKASMYIIIDNRGI